MSVAQTGSTGGGQQAGARGCGLWAEEGELGAPDRDEGLHPSLDPLCAVLGAWSCSQGAGRSLCEPRQPSMAVWPPRQGSGTETCPFSVRVVGLGDSGHLERGPRWGAAAVGGTGDEG